MITFRRRLIGLVDDAADMIAIGWDCVKKVSWLEKLPVAFLFFNPVLWFVVLSLNLSVLFFEVIRGSRSAQYDFENTECDVPTEWLVRKLSVAEAEADNSSYPDRRIIDGIPFGFSNDHWRALKDFMLADDELWYYESGNKGVQQCGYVVIRDGSSVAHFETSPVELITECSG